MTHLALLGIRGTIIQIPGPGVHGYLGVETLYFALACVSDALACSLAF